MFGRYIYQFFLGFFIFCTLKAQTCDEGWFGSRCQFQCRCQNRYCKNDGSCYYNYRCEDGWFGYRCQYQDLVYSATLQARSNYISSLKDRYKNNCLDYSNLQFVEIKLKQQYPFSWMRIVTKDSRYLTKILLSFKQGDNVLQCDNQRMYLVDNRTLDIRCKIYAAIQSVIIEGDIVQSICSVFINGGRNVALKGETSSSSSLLLKYDHKLAVDGNTNSDFHRGATCTHSNEEDKTPSWTLTLKENYLVDRIVLYNRGECCADRLRNFSLTATDKTDSYSFTYTGPDSVQSKYSVLPMKYLEISFLKIQATYIEKKWPTLTLCEVEVYGDCLPTKWGLDCANDCSSKCPKGCHIEDGTCDTSCVGYFDPPYCTKKCTPGNWGMNCSNDCGNKCYGTCNVFSGYCDEGCLGFQNPPFCTVASTVGSYGWNCTSQCSANCKQSRFQPDTGECLKCKDGYTGKFCHEDTFVNKCRTNPSEVSTNDDAFFQGLGAGIVTGVGAMIVVFIVVRVVRRRLKTKKRMQDVQHMYQRTSSQRDYVDQYDTLQTDEQTSRPSDEANVSVYVNTDNIYVYSI